MTILGIDPGTARIGYGIIEKRPKLRLVAYGTIELSPSKNAIHLLQLEKNLKNLILRYKPDRIGLESLFFSKNKKTAFSVAEARGVILLTALKHHIPVYEFSPTEIKATITGWGRSDKKTIKRCVSLSLGINQIEGHDDAADALAIALRASFNQ
ncbi:MAG: crossover junction endodeoxyribonuclease RuvC [bacterium]